VLQHQDNVQTRNLGALMQRFQEGRADDWKRFAAGQAGENERLDKRLAAMPKPLSELEKSLGKPASDEYTILGPDGKPLPGTETLTKEQFYKLGDEGKLAGVPKKQKNIYDLANQSLDSLERVRQAGQQFLPSENIPHGMLGTWGTTAFKQNLTRSPKRSQFNAATADLIGVVRTMAQGRLNKTELDKVLKPVESANSQEQLDAALNELQNFVQGTRNSAVTVGKLGGLPGALKESNIGGTPATPVAAKHKSLLDKHRK